MKLSTLLAAPVTIISVVLVIGLALAGPEPTTRLQANAVSTPTTSSGCAPRPTRTAVSIPTFRDTPRPPTAAPTRTPGPLRPIETSVPDPTLVHPLENQEEILQVVLSVDLLAADWDEPWCMETPRLEPGRITIQWYPNRNAYYGLPGPSYRDDDPRWVVTIKGGVWLRLPGGIGRSKSGGAVYFVNQKTGKIYEIGGLPPP